MKIMNGRAYVFRLFNEDDSPIVFYKNMQLSTICKCLKFLMTIIISTVSQLRAVKNLRILKHQNPKIMKE